MVNLSKVSCTQKIWLPLVPGKSKTNLFSISFFCTHASILPSGQRLHTALNTELRICIEASYVVLASCVIELRIYIWARDATTWSSVLGGRFAVRGSAYGAQVRSCRALTRVENKVWLRNSELSEEKGFVCSSREHATAKMCSQKCRRNLQPPEPAAVQAKSTLKAELARATPAYRFNTFMESKGKKCKIFPTILKCMSTRTPKVSRESFQGSLQSRRFQHFSI